MPAKIELANSFLYNHPNLYSYYPMNGNSTDSKGNVNGSDTSMTYAYGANSFNQHAVFSGSGFISLGTSKFNFTDFTISFCMVDKGTDSVRYIWARNPNADQWANFFILMYSGLKVGAGGPDLTAETYANVTNGAFYSFCMSTTATNNVTVYKNGEYLANGTSANAWNNNITNTTSIGRAGGYANYYFDGKIDDLSVFNICLNQAQVKELYNGYKAEQYLRGNRRSREVELISNKYKR